MAGAAFTTDWRRFPFGTRSASHLFAIGDVHGRADLLAALLNQLGRVPTRADLARKLVFTGDHIDRGPGELGGDPPGDGPRRRAPAQQSRGHAGRGAAPARSAAGVPPVVPQRGVQPRRGARPRSGDEPGYAAALPSVGHLFAHAKEGTIPVLRSDEGVAIDGPAWVFERRNQENRVEPLVLEELLALKGPAVTAPQAAHAA